MNPAIIDQPSGARRDKARRVIAPSHFVTVNGAWTKTRAEYLELMTRLHGASGPFRSSTRETPVMEIRSLVPDVAMMHSRFHIYGDIDEPERTGIGTRVACRIDGQWRTVAVQTRTRAPAAGTRVNVTAHCVAPALAGPYMAHLCRTGGVTARLLSEVLQPCSWHVSASKGATLQHPG